MQDFTFFLGIILVVLLGLYFSIRFIRPQQLTKHEKQFLQKHWKQIESQPDHKHAIIDADKLLDKALHMKNKKGTL
ncbi:MAG: hypothetical protein U9Q15_04440 [Patescibacteria group bacterium]|nr:hypothetical protein [Patescibacteria group bacterium]